MSLKIEHCVLAIVVTVLLTTTTAGAIGTVDDSTRQNASIQASESAADDWETYRSVVIFRNDDLKPKWGMSVLRNVDRVFIEEGVPVSQGVIPADANGSSHDADGTFCTYVREMNEKHPDVFEYALHGYSHEALTNFQGGDSEFAKLSRTQQRKRIEAGMDYYKKCVGEGTDVFIPPYNTYDETTVEVLRTHGFDVVSGGPIVEDVFGNDGAFTQGGLDHIMQSHGMIKAWHPEVTIYSVEELKTLFDQRYEDGDLYVQMLHYPHFDTSEKRERLRSLLEYMKSKDVRFMTLGEFATARQNGNLERTADGWRVRETEDRDDETNRKPTARIDIPATVEAGTVVELDATASSDDGSITDYAWYVDGRLAATGETATHRFHSPGRHSVMLDVTDDEGASATTSTTVRVRRSEPDQRFERGDRVAATEQTELRLAPNRMGIAFEIIRDGQRLTVVDGPKTSDGIVWYNVRTASGSDGWLRASALQSVP